MKLLIVESPSKTKKIAQYLGDGWQVEASFGHIRDLPSKDIGVHAPKYEPKYENCSQKTIVKLKKLAQISEEIWLATDPDREGEAIAWHLAQVICANKPYKRVTFHEITQSAVQKAIQSPRKIDNNLFLAQQGRRVLDRLFGYKVSPELGNKLGQRGVSAGRVQSVALRLVVEREEAIQSFIKTEHFGVKIQCESSAIEWSAKWDTHELTDEDKPYILDKALADVVAQSAKNGVVVTDFSENEKSRKPPAPLITSSMQQAAANKLNMSVDETMKAAQSLFEAGLITYHRTDSPNLSVEAVKLIWNFLRDAGQDEHIPNEANKWKSKADAQEAHEAIRPTDFTVRKADSGDANQDKLYIMIWRAAVASQMRSAQYKVRIAKLATQEKIDFSAIGNESLTAKFSVSGKELLYPGWLVVMKDDYTNEDADECFDNLPVLTKNSIIKPIKTEILELKTKPSSRYTEPSLVKALELEGIGRPSTYANIITTLRKREYVMMQKKQFQPTGLGCAIVNALKDHFDFMRISYTREMEEQLDEIAVGATDYVSVVKKYDVSLNEQLNLFAADQSVKTIDGKTIETYPCPSCEDGFLQRRKGKNGYFWGCCNYQNGCDCTRPDNNEAPGEPFVKNTEHPCPSCDDGFLQRRKGKNGYFWGCSGYPICRHTHTEKADKSKS